METAAPPSPPAFLRVRNFDRFQHYRDRGPTWIKLYTDLLTDWEFGRLPDDQKAALMLVWLLAAKTGNRLPNDAAYLARMTGVQRIDVGLLRAGRWLEPAPEESGDLFPEDGGGPGGGGGGNDASDSPEDRSGTASTIPETCSAKEKREESKSKSKRKTDGGDEGGTVLTFPTVGNAPTWDLREGKAAELRSAFPTLDADAEFRKAAGWLAANPSRRKTPGGMARFLFSWLSRANDRRPANLAPFARPAAAFPPPSPETTSKWGDVIARKTIGGVA